MTRELLEEVCKRLEGLDGSGWSANNDENPTSYAVLLGRYYKNPMLGFFITIEKELGDLGRPDNYYIKIRHSNSLNHKITFGGPNSKPVEVRIKSLFTNVDAKVKAYRKDLFESEYKTRILIELLKELNKP